MTNVEAILTTHFPCLIEIRVEALVDNGAIMHLWRVIGIAARQLHVEHERAMRIPEE
jgi:hypothetical protein